MIPNGWRKCRVDEIGDVQGGRQRSPNAKGTMQTYLRVANVQDGFIDTSDVLQMPFSDAEKERFLLKAGDVLLNEGQSLELVGRSAIYQGDPPDCCFQNTLIRFRSGPKANFNYAQHLFKYCQISGKFKAIASRTTSIAHLGVERLASLIVPVPPLKEQLAISAILTKWDEAILKTTELIDQKEKRRVWLMQQLLTGKRRLPGSEAPWISVKIGDVLSEVKRPVSWSDDDLYRLISVRRRSEGIFIREQLYGREIKTKKMNIAREGDFLISKMQVVHGASALVTKKFDGMNISDSYISLRVTDAEVLDIGFFNMMSKLRQMYNHALLSSYGVHIEKMTFNIDDYYERHIKIPSSIVEQRAIAKVLEDFDRELSLLRAQLDSLLEQKKGLLQQLLTGKVRVKGSYVR